MADKFRRYYYEGGINYYDLAAGDGASFPIYGEAFKDVRKDIMYQIHFCADYTNGTYGWSLELDMINHSVDRQLQELHTDYIDYGFIHCQDEFSDWETYQRIGLVNKYYDFAKAGDALAVEHYRTLGINADNCIGCGHCDKRCPFGVRQSGRMSEIGNCFSD